MNKSSSATIFIAKLHMTECAKKYNIDSDPSSKRFEVLAFISLTSNMKEDSFTCCNFDHEIVSLDWRKSPHRKKERFTLDVIIRREKISIYSMPHDMYLLTLMTKTFL